MNSNFIPFRSIQDSVVNAEVKRPKPDTVAQRAWEDVADVSDRINDLLDEIPHETVHGERTRLELTVARQALEASAEVLISVFKREVPEWERTLTGRELS